MLPDTQSSPLQFLPSSSGLLRHVLAIVRLSLRTCHTAFDTHNCCATPMLEFRNLTFRNAPICRIIIDGVPIGNQTDQVRDALLKSTKRTWTVSGIGTYLLRSSESIISRCFSRSALVASLPASSSSSLILTSTGFQSVFESLRSLSTVVVGAAASVIVAPMASFCMSTNRLLIFLTTFANSARVCATGSCSSVWTGKSYDKP